MDYDTLYLNTHEAALAVVATAMKKARLRIDTLVINSILGGVLFSSGGMLYIQVMGSPGLSENNPGVLHLLEGLVYSIGLFYVVILGMELFNSNVLFFSAAIVRGGVSFIDLSINWFTSWWFNLAGNIFVCYVICNYSKISQETLFIETSINVVKEKVACSFVETFLRAIAGNFYVSLAIYLQIMTKPLHVKFLMMTIPVFTFVSLGFTHSVADMYLLTIGFINGAPVSVGEAVWKTFLPGVLGNIVGGSFFGIALTWYSHIVVVERDRKELNLPEFELRDEQPDLNMDSRVVRQRLEDPEEYTDNLMDEKSELHSNTSGSPYVPEGIVSDSRSLSRMYSRASRLSTRSGNYVRSPKNVFPVYGMGPALQRERSIASGREIISEQDDERNSIYENQDYDSKTAELLSSRLKNLFNKGTSVFTNHKGDDIEAQKEVSTTKPVRLTKGDLSNFNRFIPLSFRNSNSKEKSKSSVSTGISSVPNKGSNHASIDSDDTSMDPISYLGTSAQTTPIQINNMGAVSERTEQSSASNKSIN